MDEGFEDLGAVSIKVVNADKIIVGILEDSPEMIALAVGISVDSEERPDFYLVECDPPRARQIAASLLNKADSIDGV